MWPWRCDPPRSRAVSSGASWTRTTRAPAAAFAERSARSPRILDACRFALDRLAARAERAGVTVALEISGGPWGAPTPREAAELLEEYREAPLGVVWDAARSRDGAAFRVHS